VKVGLVASLARPGGNMTGVNFFAAEIASKRLEYLRALVPGAVRVAALLNPANPNMEAVSRDLETAARAMGLRIQAYHASTVDEIDASFSALARDGADALFVGNDGFFNSRRVQFGQQVAWSRPNWWRRARDLWPKVSLFENFEISYYILVWERQHNRRKCRANPNSQPLNRLVAEGEFPPR